MRKSGGGLGGGRSPPPVRTTITQLLVGSGSLVGVSGWSAGADKNRTLSDHLLGGSGSSAGAVSVRAPVNWWVADKNFARARLYTSGLRVRGRPRIWKCGLPRSCCWEWVDKNLLTCSCGFNRRCLFEVCSTLFVRVVVCSTGNLVCAGLIVFNRRCLFVVCSRSSAAQTSDRV